MEFRSLVLNSCHHKAQVAVEDEAVLAADDCGDCDYDDYCGKNNDVGNILDRKMAYIAVALRIDDCVGESDWDENWAPEDSVADDVCNPESDRNCELQRNDDNPTPPWGCNVKLTMSLCRNRSETFCMTLWELGTHVVVEDAVTRSMKEQLFCESVLAEVVSVCMRSSSVFEQWAFPLLVELGLPKSVGIDATSAGHRSVLVSLF